MTHTAHLSVLGVSEADLVVADVELGVEAADEDVPQNPQGSAGRRDVHAGEAAQADGLTLLCNLTKPTPGGRAERGGRG